MAKNLPLHGCHSLRTFDLHPVRLQSLHKKTYTELEEIERAADGPIADDSIGGFMKRIAAAAPLDMKGRLLLSDLLEQEPKYAEKTELCRLVLTAMHKRNAALGRYADPI